MQHGTPEIGSPSRSQRTRNLRSHHSDREHPLKEFPLGIFPQRFRLSTNTHSSIRRCFAVRSSQQASHALSAAVVVLTGSTRSLFPENRSPASIRRTFAPCHQGPRLCCPTRTLSNCQARNVRGPQRTLARDFAYRCRPKGECRANRDRPRASQTCQMAQIRCRQRLSMEAPKLHGARRRTGR